MSFRLGIIPIAFAAITPLAGLARPSPADETSLVLSPGDFARTQGLDAAVNDPALADRPVVEVAPDRSLRLRVRFRPFVMNDPEGGPLVISAPRGWAEVYASLARGERPEVDIEAPVSGGVSLRFHRRLDGPPGDKPLLPFDRVAIEDETGRVLGGPTPTRLVAKEKGLSGLLAATEAWEGPPAVVGRELTLRLRPLVGAVEGDYRWRFEWPREGQGPLATVLAASQGRPATVTLALAPGSATEAVAFRVLAPWVGEPWRPFRPARAIRVLAGGTKAPEVLEVPDLAALPAPRDLFWHADYSEPPEVADGVLLFRLKPYEFRDVRGDSVTGAPEAGWMKFYLGVRRGDPVTVAFPGTPFRPLDRVRLSPPPPAPRAILVPELPVARVSSDRPDRLGAILPGEPDRIVSMVRRGAHLYWPERALVGRPAARSFLFREESGGGYRLVSLNRDVGEVASVEVPPDGEPGLLPQKLTAEPGLSVWISHVVPKSLGYELEGWSASRNAGPDGIDLKSGSPVDLRFARRLTIGQGDDRFELEPPYPPGDPRALREGRIDPKLARWWRELSLSGRKRGVKTLLIVDGSLPDRSLTSERVAEWKVWAEVLAKARESLGPRLDVAIARQGLPRAIEASLPTGATGPSTFPEPSFAIELRNLAAARPDLERVVVWASGTALSPVPDRSWTSQGRPTPHLLQLSPTTPPDQVLARLLKELVGHD